MASTASDLLKFEKQATGENASTWGTKANTAMSRIEEAIAGFRAITMVGANYTLDDTQYSENSTTTSESHLAMIKVTGAPGASYKLVIPLRTKTYLIWNIVTTYSITIGASSGDTVTLPTGELAWVFCDGTNTEFASVPFTAAGVLGAAAIAAASTTVSGISELLTNAEAITGSDTTRSMTAAAMRAALVDGNDTILGKFNLKDYGEVTNAIGSTGGGTQDIDLTLGNNVVATVDTGANTFTFSNPTASDELCGFTLFLTNGGSQTVTWPASVDWAAATAPTLTTSGLDILVFVTTDGGTIWHGMVASAASA